MTSVESLLLTNLANTLKAEAENERNKAKRKREISEGSAFSKLAISEQTDHWYEIGEADGNYMSRTYIARLITELLDAATKDRERK